MEMAREFRRLASYKTDEHIKPFLDKVLDVCHNAITEPPTYLHQISDFSPAFRYLDESLSSNRKQKSKILPAVIATIEHSRSQGLPDSISKTQAVLKGFGEVMGSFGLKSSLNAQVPIDDETLKRGRANSALSSTARRVERPDNLHPEATSPYQVHTIKAREYPASPPTLSQDRTSVQMEIPTTTASEKERVDTMMFKVSLVIEEQPGKWRKVSLAKPVTTSEYDPKSHIPSQMLDFWTNNLPPEKVRYAIAIEAVPWESQHEHADTMKKVYCRFTNPETEDALIEGLKGVNDFDRDYDGGGNIFISKHKATSLLEQLRRDKRGDILSLPVTGRRKWKAQVDTYHLSYCVRIGTIENPGQAIPLKILLDHSKHIGYELMSVPNRKIDAGEEDKDESSILQALQPTNSTDQDTSLVPLIFTSADTNFASTVGDQDTNVKVSSRELFIQPLARYEVLREGEGWTGNVVQVIPNLNHKSQSIDREEEVKIATFEDLLELYASKNTGDITPILLKAPKIFEKLTEAEEVARRIFDLTTNGGSFNFRQPNMYSLGFNPAESGRLGPAYTGASTTFGTARDAGESRVGTASVLGQFPPVTIRLVVQENQQ